MGLTSPQMCSLALDRLSSHQSVVWVEKHYEMKISNAYSRYTTQSGIQGSSPIWDAGLTGNNQVIGISDTGIDMKSCFFYDSSEDAPYDTISSTHRKMTTYITYVDSSDPTGGHGTHVAGSAAGSGSSIYDGMAYDAKIAFFDIGDANENLDIPTNLNDDFYQEMRDAGARIMSGSWGAATASYNFDSYYSDEFMDEFEDSVVLYAAGNDGEDGAGSIGAPATGKSIIAVGAGNADQASWDACCTVNDDSLYGEDTVASFSSQGPTDDGLLKPDIVAPGHYIASAKSDSSEADNHCFAFWNAGTSMVWELALITFYFLIFIIIFNGRHVQQLLGM